ncbi:uncharacterized protein LOC127110585 [Lathyrus oleraceus]|uniref:uncharacterized protein LOC127110585 n=1 Tax=Pisum sativum TaxID=3888 RepID=UPI0021D1C9B6|nr:uncharacterized protein LOC127110585 [Pisum sativum]
MNTGGYCIVLSFLDDASKHNVSLAARALHPLFRMLYKHWMYLGLTVNQEHNLHAKIPSYVSYPAVTAGSGHPLDQLLFLSGQQHGACSSGFDDLFKFNSSCYVKQRLFHKAQTHQREVDGSPPEFLKSNIWLKWFRLNNSLLFFGKECRKRLINRVNQNSQYRYMDCILHSISK